MCPSDAEGGRGNINNYFASCGPNSRSASQSSVSATGVVSGPGTPGLFSYSFAYGVRDTTDGTSNTIAFSEALVSPSAGKVDRRTGMVNIVDPGGNPASATNDANSGQRFSAFTNPAAVLALMTACDQAWLGQGGSPTFTNSVGSRWCMGVTGWTMFSTLATPNERLWTACRVGCSGCGIDNTQIMSATSGHPGGVNVAFGDGSVKFIKNSVNRLVWWGLGTRNGGEVISSDSY